MKSPQKFAAFDPPPPRDPQKAGELARAYVDAGYSPDEAERFAARDIAQGKWGGMYGRSAPARKQAGQTDLFSNSKERSDQR